jgi:hypothetical protein
VKKEMPMGKMMSGTGRWAEKAQLRFFRMNIRYLNAPRRVRLPMIAAVSHAFPPRRPRRASI